MKVLRQYISRNMSIFLCQRMSFRKAVDGRKKVLLEGLDIYLFLRILTRKSISSIKTPKKTNPLLSAFIGLHNDSLLGIQSRFLFYNFCCHFQWIHSLALCNFFYSAMEVEAHSFFFFVFICLSDLHLWINNCSKIVPL